jgi:hypothetical protein
VNARKPDPPPFNDDALIEQLNDLSADDRKGLQETLAALMSDQVGRIDYTTSSLNALATVAGVLLAAGVAGLLQVTKSGWDYFPARLGVFVLVVSLTVTGSVVLWVWGRQTNWDYPFKKVSRTWKHFYRDALAGLAEPKVRWDAKITSKYQAKKGEQYKEGRAGFIERALSLCDSSVSLAQDIEQSYLLHWTDLYKNQFLTRLGQLFVYGVIVSLILALLAFGISVPVAGDVYDNNSSSTSSGAASDHTSTTTTTITTTTHK